MVATKKDLHKASHELLKAEATQVPIATFTDRFQDFNLQEAYAIQLIGVKTRTGRGEVVVGKKIGLCSKAMQDMFGVKEPDYGHILNTMIVPTTEQIQLGRLIQPRVEAEICFILKDELKGPGVNTARVLTATAGVMPALEIIDSRFKGWKVKIQDTVSDNAAAALIVLGGQMTEVSNIDLRLIGAVLEKNGQIAATAAGASVLGNPVEAVAWLANKLGEYGISLLPGELIMSGSVAAAVPAESGSCFTATFDRLGSVTTRFSD